MQPRTNVAYSPQAVMAGSIGPALSPCAQIDPPAGLQGLAVSLIVMSMVLLSYFGDQSAELMAMVSQIVVALLTGMIVIGRVFSKGFFRMSREAFFALLLLVWILVSFPLTFPSNVAMAISISLYVTQVKIVLVSIVAANAINGRRAFQMALWAVILAAFIASLGGLTGALRGGADSAATGADRYAGNFGNANQMGNLCTLALWAATVLFCGIRGAFRKVILGPLSLGLLVALARTGSRQAMIALLVIAGAFYWFVVRRTTKNIPAKITLLLGAFLAFVAYLIYLSTTPHWARVLAMLGLSENRWDTLSDSSRSRFLMTSFHNFVYHPFTGIGQGALRIDLVGGDLGPNFEMGYSPHNTIFSIGAAWGLPGWLLFYGLLLMAFLRVRRVSKMCIPLPDRNMLLACFGVYLAIGVWSFTSELVYIKHFWIVILANVAYVEWVETTYRSAVVYYPEWRPPPPDKRGTSPLPARHGGR